MNPESKKSDDRDFVCIICGVHFSEEKQFYGHLRIHTGEVLWSCVQCPNSNVKFNSLSRLRMHENTYHNVIRPFKCQECSMEFDRASQLDYHQRSVHLGEKSHICQICEKGFFRKTDLRTHLNIHLGTNVCICEVCGRKFNHVSNLIRHCRTHAGIKPYPCTVCGKRFTQISSLVRHKRIHEKARKGDQNDNTNVNFSSNKQPELEEKPVQKQRIIKRKHYCKICGESFKFILLLRQHEKEHLNDEKSLESQVESKNVEESKEPSAIEESVYESLVKEVDPDNYFSQIDILAQKTNDNFIGECDNITDLPYSPLMGQDKRLDSTMCITSEQLEQISLEKMDDVGIRLPEEQVLELVGNINSLEMPLAFQENDTFPMLRETSTDDPDVIHFLPRMSSQDEIEPFESNAMRLVQIENGQQFYELIMDSLGEKTCPSPKNPEKEIEDAINFEKNFIDDSSFQSRQSLHEFEFFKANPYEGTVFDNLHHENYAEQLLQFDQSEKLAAPADEFFNLVDDHSRPDDLLVEDNLNPEMDQLKISKSNSHLESNTLDFLICVIDNVKEKEELEKTKEKIEEETKEKIEEETKEKIEERTQEKIEEKTKEDKPQMKEEKKKEKKFHCDVCNKSYSTGYNFKQHIGTHFSEQQNFKCKECEMTFAWKSTLNKHIANCHSNEDKQSFVCDICPKVYSTLSQLNVHVKRDHLKERNHVCPDCGKSFFKKFDLKTHCRTHTNERPYVCRFCGKGFHHRSHIIRHKRIHSGEKPYACDICQKSFSQKASLTAHRQKHKDKLNILDYKLEPDSPLASAL